MENIYSEDQYCMEFSNEEILDFLVNPLVENYNLPLKIFAKDQEEFNADTDKIGHVFIDEERDFFFSFLGFQTSLFIFEEEIMFIDDIAKNNIVSSHTYGNIVYEGSLRGRTHKEILKLMYDISVLLLDVKKVDFEELRISQTGIQYPKCEYKVKLYSDSIKNVYFDNIFFTSVGN
ncbi:hypothetical protein B9G55_11160 [Saccharibacillus sp. O16]|nr:hypothetical protein B9G55_11160 [Saccharibacillus sp. O16]